MRPSEPRRGTFRRRLAGGPVDSRWWYWVAAIPATFALWAISVAWVAVAVAAGSIGDSNPVVQAAEISLVVFGAPFLALSIVFPFAVYADAGAVLEAGVDWRPPRATLTGAAVIGPMVAIAGWLVDWVADGTLEFLGSAVVVGFLLTLPVAAFYLYRRQGRLGVP